MIYMFECQHSAWQHQVANSILIRNVSRRFPNEEIIVAAKKMHLESLQYYQYSENVHFEIIDEAALKITNADIMNIREYDILLKKMFSKHALRNNDKVIFMNSSRAAFCSISKIASKYKKVNFYTVIHAISEKIIGDGMMKEDSQRFSLKKALDRYLNGNNTYLITYSPCSIVELKKVFPEKKIKRIFFLHLETYARENKMEKKVTERSNQPTIVVYGACFNSNAISFINSIIDSNIKRINIVVLIRTIGKTLIAKNIPKNITIIQKNVYTKNEIESFIDKADWILIPYDKKEYKIAASGIFSDIMIYNKPILALDSPYIDYYQKMFNIGFVCSSIDEMVEKCIEIYHMNTKDYLNYVNNIKKMKQYMENENTRIIFDRVK